LFERRLWKHNREAVRVNMADGSESKLADIRRRAMDGGVGVFFGTAQKQALNQIMQARGHMVVLLSADGYRREAERRSMEATKRSTSMST
jgi:hypothetical protein